MNKKQLFLIITCVMIFCLVACGVNNTETNVELKSDTAQIQKGEADNSLKDVLNRDALRIGVYANNEPFTFKNEKGELLGFDIDIAKKTAAAIGVDAEFVEITSDSALESGKIDVLWSGCKVEPETESKVLFSVPYVTTKHIIVVKANSETTFKEMLDGEKIGIQVGCCSESFLENDEIFSKLEEKDILTFYDIPTALAYLRNDQAKALVLDEMLYHYYSADETKYMVLEDKLGTEEYAVEAKPEAKELIQEIDSALMKLKENKITDDVYEKWFVKKEKN